MLWWALRGSNSRPNPCKGSALPTELSAHLGGLSSDACHCVRRGPNYRGWLSRSARVFRKNIKNLFSTHGGWTGRRSPSRHICMCCNRGDTRDIYLPSHMPITDNTAFDKSATLKTSQRCAPEMRCRGRVISARAPGGGSVHKKRNGDIGSFFNQQETLQ